MSAQENFCIALDVNSTYEAWCIVEKTRDVAGWFKVNHALATRGYLPSLVRMMAVMKEKRRIFYDMKHHDAPTTVVHAVKEAVDLGVNLISMHATCGPRALEEVVKVKGSAKILAVTVLTTFDDADCIRLYSAPVRKLVERWGRMAIEAGVDGLIASAHELDIVRSVGSTFNVTPGIRPNSALQNDQKRSATPTQAIKMGSDLVIVGRPVTAPLVGSSVRHSAKLIADEISAALKKRG